LRALCDWIKRFVIFDGKRRHSGLGGGEAATVLAQLDQLID
jgi:hypothetical protein